MIKIPGFIYLLSTIKQFYPEEEALSNPDQDWLVTWAKMTALFQLQLNGKAISCDLTTRLREDLPQLQKIIANLNRNGAPGDLIAGFNRAVEEFYEELHQLNDTLTNEEIEQNWQEAIQAGLQPIPTGNSEQVTVCETIREIDPTKTTPEPDTTALVSHLDTNHIHKRETPSVTNVDSLPKRLFLDNDDYW